MARWHLTTSQETHTRASTVCEDAELTPCGDASDDHILLRSYAKRAVKNVNFVSLGPREWICMAGTVLVDGKLGGDALPLFFERFVQEGLTAARGAAIGHYAVCVRQGDRVSAFTDEQASIPLFYGSLNSHEHVLSNSLQVAAAGLDAIEADQLGLLLSVFHGEIGEDTFIWGVRRLLGTQAIELDLSTRTLSVRRAPACDARLAPEEDADIESAVRAYAARIREVFSQIAAQPSLGLHATGGLDTRTVLAGLLAVGARPPLMFGVGNSDLTGTRTHDLKAVRALAETLQLPLHEMDWSGTQPHSEAMLSSLYRRYGFLRRYGMSEGFLREMEGGITPYPALHIGGYGISQRARTWGQRVGRGIDGLTAEMSSLEEKKMTPPAYVAYRARMKEAIRQEVEEIPHRTGGDGLTPEEYAQAQFIVRRSIELRAPSFFNEFAFYLTPLWTKWLNDPFFTGPMEYQADGAFQLRLIRELAPQVLNTPVYSGDMARTLDKERLALSRPRSARLWRIQRALYSRVFPRSFRQAFVSRLALYRFPYVPGLSNDMRKDARVSDLVRRHVIRKLHSDYPTVAGLFRSLQLPLYRLYDLYWKLHAGGENR